MGQDHVQQLSFCLWKDIRSSSWSYHWKVLSHHIHEYWLLGIIENSIYFSRAAYNLDTETLTPSIEEMSKYCVCEKPYNPDLEWAECEKCAKWFHMDCVIMLGKNVKDFVCAKCEKKDVSTKKKKKWPPAIRDSMTWRKLFLLTVMKTYYDTLQVYFETTYLTKFDKMKT